MADATFRIEVEVDATNARASVGNFLNSLRSNTSGLDTEINKIERSLNGAGAAQQKFAQNLSTTRYALYDVSSTLAVTGAALLGLSVGATAVAIAWERDFAQVVRTTGVMGDEVEQLRGQLVGLAQTMPVAFGDIAKIATLAGQLGVAEDQVASFTSTVIKFSTASNLSVEDAATAFGRLDSLLPDVRGNYEALGSAIALVGVNSVATESQIVKIATQISSMGALAGLTTGEVVGLSGALASVGAQPEISRGTIVRLFTEMQEAISGGGEKLEKFAQISQVSSQEFASAFGTDRFGPILTAFISNLDDVAIAGGDSNTVLRELGITSSRDIPLLQRLAGAGTLLADSIRDGNQGFAEATELNRQYGIISETTAAKLQVLVNNFMALLDAIGSANLGPLGDVLDGLSDFLGFVTDFVATDVGGRIAGTLVVIGGLAGVLAIIGGAMALATASSIGLTQGLAGLTAIAPRTTAALVGSGTAAQLASGQFSTAAVSARLLLTALKALAAVTIVLALPDIADWLNKGVDQMKGFSNELAEVKKRITDPGTFYAGESAIQAMVRAIDQGNGSMNEFNRFFANANFGTAAAMEVKKYDDQLAELARGGNLEFVQREIKSLGLNSKEVANILPATAEAIKETKNAASGGGEGIDAMNEQIAETEAAASEAKAALDALRDSITSFNDVSVGAEEAQLAYFAALDKVRQGAADTAVAFDSTTQGGRDFIQSLIDLEEAAGTSAQAMIDNGGTVDEATARYRESRQAIIDAITAKTGDAAAAAAWADQILGTSAEAEGAIAAYSAEVNRVPTRKDTTLENNGPAAGQSVRAYIEELERTPRRIVTDMVTNYYSTGEVGNSRPAPVAGRNYASGGQIFGPGTGTSDSILARVSNGEYIVKAAAVNYYGPGLMNAINSMRVPRFASGGQVNANSSPASSWMTGVVELGPQTMSVLAREVTNNILIDDVAISRAAHRGDAKRRAMGDMK